MQKWWNWLVALTLVCFVFIAIPLYLNKERTKDDLRPMFEEYVQKFNKSYKNNVTEYERRLEYFVASVYNIERLNSLSRGPEEHRAHYGLTMLSDMSAEEYKDIHLSDEKFKKMPSVYGRSWNKYRDSKSRYMDKNYYDYKDRKEEVSVLDVQTLVRKKRASLPLQVDWRSKGMVGPVRDQGLCGACWAFSTVGVMESMQAMKTGVLEPLSVQEVIDCAGLGNSGCLGGDICLLLDWLLITHSVVQTERAYPLRLNDGTCKLKSNATGVKLKAFTCDQFIGAEDKILEALATHGPVAVAVNALTWQNYLGGVIQYHCSGAPTDLNHAVQLVGYDLTADVPYYIAKNSWGPEFGNVGYLRLAIGSNICGLANEVASLEVA